MNIEEKIILEFLKTKVKTGNELSKIKRNFAKKTGSALPSNATLLKAYHKIIKKNTNICKQERIETEQALKTTEIL